MIVDSTPILKVGMADLKAAQAPSVLKTSGLGSCIGLCLFDPQLHIAGMAHVMLPSSEIAREQMLNIAKYADTAIPALIDQMIQLGAAVRNLQAKMAGGAQMFALAQSDMMRIGPRNIESCKLQLQVYNIPLLAEDTGGNYGRSVEIDCANGNVLVKSVQNGVRQL